MFNNSDLSTEQFLADYWQKKPLLIRQAFPDFEPLLDADDIAGLACDEMAESRLVTGGFPQHDWQLRYGPFTEEDFQSLPEENWTLLIQDVEKHYPPLKSLMKKFDFLPRWRIDDLMVSVAGPGGSVGPHVDQYDVFLLQASGSRRWQISESFDATLRADCELNVLQSFIPEQDWTLGPGDLLYLPPGVAHHGVALDQGMTWSVGMRAPSTADLFQTFGEWLAEHEDEGGRYRDPGLEVPLHNGQVDPDSVRRFQELVKSTLGNTDEFSRFLGSFLSRYRMAHEPAPPESAMEPAKLLETLVSGSRLRQNPWTRLLWIETTEGARIFAAGSAYPCTTACARTLCDTELLGQLDASLPKPDLDLVCELLNQGHLYLEQL
jgi:50S ribosomal protein L16 3-hydroxylase